MIKGVFLDYWNTLYVLNAEPGEYHRLRVLSMLKVLEGGGRRVSYSDLYEAYINVRRKCDAHRKKTLRECPGIQEIDWICRKLGLDVSGDILDRLLDAYMAPFRRYLSLRPGAAEFVKDARRMGLRLGIISNSLSGHYARLNLARDGLLGYFDVTIFSDEVGFRKPHPEIFLFALSQLGLRPDETVMVGDDPETDAAGAKGVGMIAVLIGGQDDDADFIVGGFRELSNLIERLRR